MKHQCQETVKGKPCKSPSVRKYGSKWLCTSHARKLKVIDDSQWREKASQGSKKFNESRALMLAKITQASKVDYFLGIDHNSFNAAEEWPLIRQANLMPMMEYGSEKYLVGLWLMSNPDTREPKNLANVAEVVGVAFEELQRWIRSKEMLDIFDDQSTRVMRARRGLVDAMLFAKCMAGSEKAFHEYYERYGGKPPVGRPPTPEMPPAPGEYERRTTLTQVERGTDPTPRLHSAAARIIAAKLKQRGELPGAFRESDPVPPGTAVTPGPMPGLETQAEPAQPFIESMREIDKIIAEGEAPQAPPDEKPKNELKEQAMKDHPEATAGVGGEDLGSDEEEGAKLDDFLASTFREVVETEGDGERVLPPPPDGVKEGLSPAMAPERKPEADKIKAKEVAQRRERFINKYGNRAAGGPSRRRGF